MNSQEKRNYQEKIKSDLNFLLVGWYENAKIDYNIDGCASVTIDDEENELHIFYMENGVKKIYTSAFYYDESVYNARYFYNCWMELG